jgi:hypothetical protein
MVKGVFTFHAAILPLFLGQRATQARVTGNDLMGGLTVKTAA